MSPPAPVTDTVHGVWAEPSYTTLAGQVTTVVELAVVMSNVSEPLLPLWLASPGKV